MIHTKEVTAEDYAEYKGCTVQNIRKHIKNNNLHYLPDVIRIRKYSRFYLLVVPDRLPIKSKVETQ